MTSQLPPKRAQPPAFGSCLLWPNGWMDEDATWYGSRPRPRPYCIRRSPVPDPCERGTPPPLFGPCLLWSQSPISVSAELLLVWYYGSMLKQHHFKEFQIRAVDRHIIFYFRRGSIMKLDGCIVWTAHNTVLGSKHLTICTTI